MARKSGKRRGRRPEGEAKWLPFPKSTGSIVARAVAERRVSNFGLLFQRYICYPNQKWVLEGGEKQELFRKLKNSFNDPSLEISKHLPDIVNALNQRMEAIVNSMSGFQAEELEAEVCWRMVVGLGAASILEVGLTLHHVYGLPYLPPSSFKGLVQSYALMCLAKELGVRPLDAPAYKQRRENRRPTPMQMLEEMLTLDPHQEEEKKRLRELKEKLCSDEALAHDAPIRQKSIDELAILGEDFRRVFGSTAREGEVIFFDVFPSKVPKLELDIMNPHYGPYYTDEKGEKPPADYYSPVPVYFLALKKGTRFRFRWASKDDHLLGCVKDWLKEAIKVFGVGAKTRAGYGELR